MTKDENELVERNMLIKMQETSSELYSVYCLLFDYDVKKINKRITACSKAELCVRSKKGSMSLGTVTKAEIVDGYFLIYVTDKEGNEVVTKMKLDCD